MKNPIQARTLLLAALLAGAAGGAFAQWKPTRPINLIVPWAAGGSTDQITRVTAAELEKALGQTIVIVNQPGRLGLDRHARARSMPPRTATPGPPARRRTSAPTRRSARCRRSISDWNLFLTVANIQVIGVNPSTPVPERRSSCSTR